MRRRPMGRLFRRIGRWFRAWIMVDVCSSSGLVGSFVDCTYVCTWIAIGE